MPVPEPKAEAPGRGQSSKEDQPATLQPKLKAEDAHRVLFRAPRSFHFRPHCASAELTHAHSAMWQGTTTVHHAFVAARVYNPQCQMYQNRGVGQIETNGIFTHMD